MIRELTIEMRAMKERSGMVTAVEDLLIAHGIEGVGSPLPKGMKRGPARHCYMNAGRIALDEIGYDYVEGLACNSVLPFPVAHAWLIDGEGRMIEPTWKQPKLCAYFGVVIPTKMLRREVLRKEMWGVLEDWCGYNDKFIERLMKQLKKEKTT